MKTKFIPISHIVDDILSLRDYDRIEVDNIYKTVSDFVKKIETDEQYVHKVALIPVSDHTAKIPDDSQIILQVAFNDHTINHKPQTKERIKEWVQKVYDGSECEYTISLNCPDCKKETCTCDSSASSVTIEVDDIWRQQHPEYQYMRMNHLYRWGGMNKNNIPTSRYCQDFVLIKYAQHNFTNADMHIGGCLNLDERLMSGCTAEYTIQNNYFKINRERGEILLAYLGRQLCSDGYPMVPDTVEVIEAAKWYYEESTSYREWRRTKQQADYMAYKEAKAERRFLMGIINEKLQTPSFVQWMTFLSNNWKRSLKNNNLYGDMNKQSPNYYSDVLTGLTHK